MHEITIPKKLQPLVEAFFTDSEDVAKTLIVQAIQAIYSTDDSAFGRKRKISREELKDVCILMQNLNPQDMLEALFAAQIVVAHMLGMRKLTKDDYEENRIGLKMLRFSNEALTRLQKKRTGCMQNITVNYNYHEKASAAISTSNEIEYAD